MDETREFVYQKQIQRQRGEYPDEDGVSSEEVIVGKARAVRYFYLALVNEGFSEQDALKIIVSVPV